MAAVEENINIRIWQNVKNKEEELFFAHTVYPDKQQSVKFDKDVLRSNTFKIKVRITSMTDLELLACVVSAVRRAHRLTSIECDVVYCIGGRSDRQFEFGMEVYCEDVIGRFLKNLDFNRLRLLDPHSNVLIQASGALPYYKVHDLTYHLSPAIKQDEMFILFPDFGAQERYDFFFRSWPYRGYADKSRDEKGNITKLTFSKLPPPDKHIVVVDDLCDGGATFIRLAEKLNKDQIPYRDLTLVVTHGLFSKGFDELSKYYRRIITSNSYCTRKTDQFLLIYNVL